MSDIQYDEDPQSQYQRPSSGGEQKSSFVRFLLSVGIVSDERAAEYILLGTAVIAVLLSLVAPFVFGTGGGRQLPHLYDTSTHKNIFQ